ncbi:MAG TPA: glycosyltransferase, partial [Gemmatales bacterium]|nr:glycosyltransferase [Gemmatales bacterium]
MKQQLKVALLAYKDSWESGGSLRVAQLLSEHLPRDLVDAHLVFAYGEPGSVSRHSTRSVHHLKFQSSRDWRRFPEARSWLRKQNFDILHFIDSIHWLIALSLGLKTKRILHFHGTPDLSAMAWSDQLLGVCKRWVADAGIAITHGARRGVTRLGWMSPRKL